MAAARKSQAPTVDFHPRLQVQPPPQIDAGQVTAPVAKMIGYGITCALILVASVGAYYSIIGRIDRLDDRMQAQGRSIESLARSVERLANEALTASDLKAACMQMALTNKGWQCPFAGGEIKPRAATIRTHTSVADWPADTKKQ